ncbi:MULTISPECIES: hypothetical protein [unclassified Oscillibacter]|uniref:hypothetical protein n=1 Tax=unclassified Oscillibacter TaxID=2629304 RepID=UPI0025F33488|nr:MULTISPECIES: hypothetical protein [unclassified Oscillibacter]
MNYIEEALRRQAAIFGLLLGGGQRRKEDEEKQAERNGETEAESGGDGALRLRSFDEGSEERPGSPGEMAAWNRLLARRREGRLHQAAGMREMTVTEIPSAGSMGAESPFMESGLADTAQLNAEKNAVWKRNSIGAGQGFGGAELIFPEEFFEDRGTHDGTAGTVPVADGGVSAGTMLVVDGGMSAGELSRAFQRDARRYDGGYPLY